jgi:hypothetical protein
MVRNLKFSKHRIMKFIKEIQVGEAVDFSEFSKLGGTSQQITAFLRTSESLLYENTKWRRI